MSSNLDTIVTVFGGSGFLGRHIVRALAKRDYRIRAAVRRPDLAGHLQPLGRVGQIMAVQANIRYPASIEAAMRDASIVINVVGAHVQSGAQTFEAVHHRGAAAVAQAAAKIGARLIHISGIGADERSPARAARAKAAGEKAVLSAVPTATILRPSVVFGPEDQFTNRLGSLARLFPVLPLIAGETKVQPVFVGDIAAAVAEAADGKAGALCYELGGPDVMTMRQVNEFVLRTAERARVLMPMPAALARLKAAFLQFAPQPLQLTPDQVDLLRLDNVVSNEAIADHRTLEGLGIAPTPMARIAPSWLWRFRKTGQFQIRADA